MSRLQYHVSGTHPGKITVLRRINLSKFTHWECELSSELSWTASRIGKIGVRMC